MPKAFWLYKFIITYFYGGNKNGSKNQTAPHGRKEGTVLSCSCGRFQISRNGRFIEEIGTYNTMVDPAEVKIDGEKAKKWIANGAQPTDTVKAILKKEGIL